VIQAASLSTGKTTTRQYTLPVVQPVLITTTSLPDAVANRPYSVQLQSSGGSGQVLWSIPAGTLPPGISLNSSTGVFSGTAPGVNSSYTFAVQVADQAIQTSDAVQLTINVVGGLSITTTTLPNATLNQPYSFQLLGTGAPNPLWSVDSQSILPPGLQLSTSGVLSGSGLFTGKYAFTIQLKDEQLPGIVTRTFAFFVTLGPLGISEVTLPNATQNVPYNVTLTPVGGIPPYTWSFDVANPAGLSIGAATGIISGTPPNAGAFTVPITLTDSTGAVFSKSYTLGVANGVSINKTSLANGPPGVPYSDTVTATGGVFTYKWDVIAGNLPTGLTLNQSTGQISGTPTTQGSFQFTIQVTDFVGGKASKVFTITIGPGLAITTATLPGGALTQAYSQTLTVTGGTSPFTWTIASGALPPSLALNAATGEISGTPTAVGNFAFDISVTDAGQAAARRSFSITITNPVVITSGNVSGNVLTTFSQTLAATGGTPPYTWSVSSGTLPAGLQLNSTTGVISGSPSAGGTNQVTFTATDASGRTGTKTIAITIVLPQTPPTLISLGTTTQPAVSLSTSATYPLTITGVLTLGFTPLAGVDGNEARFSDGTRSLAFTVPANTTQATFPTAPNAAILPGTVAGTITLTASMSAGGQDITPSPAPIKTITIDPAVPVITSVTLQQVSGGLSVVVKGSSNTRDVSSGSFTFTVSGSAIAAITVPLTSAFTTWFNNAASGPTGGVFQLTVPFSVSQGAATSVTKVSVTLTNSRGTSAAVSSP